MTIQNNLIRSVPISKVAAILKFFKRYFHPNHRTEACWEASMQHGDSDLLKSFNDIYSYNISSRTICQIEPKRDAST